jgi:hypothetical protein
MFALRRDGSLYVAKSPIELKDLSYSHLWAAVEVFELRRGPAPSVGLTRALIKEMRDFAESNGAKFVVVDWDYDGEFPWGLAVDVIRLSVSPPAGWDDWIIPGETHPDPRAHVYVSELIAKEVKRIMTDGGELNASAPERNAVGTISK